MKKRIFKIDDYSEEKMGQTLNQIIEETSLDGFALGSVVPPDFHAYAEEMGYPLVVGATVIGEGHPGWKITSAKKPGVLLPKEAEEITKPKKEEIPMMYKGKTIKMPYHDPRDETLNEPNSLQEYKLKTKYANWYITDEGEPEFMGIGK